MPKASKGAAFYAVKKGRIPGIYYSWDDCKAQVDGFPGGTQKKFRDIEEAEEWLCDGAPSSHAQAPVSSGGHRQSASAASPPRSSSSVPTPQTGSSTSASQSHFKSASATTSPEAAKSTRKASIPSEDVGHDVVYSDGSCRGNGQAGSVAGIGVWWGRSDPRNLAERCPGAQTNNRAELIAIVRLLESTPISKVPLTIKTDSQYSIKCVNEWLPKWARNGFRTADGQPVKNQPVIRYLSALLDMRARAHQKVSLKYVQGHVGIEGNEGADMLANRGAMLPEEPERDWEALQDALYTLQQTNAARAVEITDDDLAAYAAGILSPEELEQELMEE